MNLYDALTRQFIAQVAATPAGRAHLYNQIADAEDNGEAPIFDDAERIVDDPQLKKLIARHKADEIGHGELFRAARDRTGVDPGPVPDALKVLDHINRRLGGFFDRPLRDLDDVVEAYLILQVIEERAVSQFGIIAEVLKGVDPLAAETFRQVEKDEDRHLRYCRAVAKRHGKGDAATGRRLAELRIVEADAFREMSIANVELCIERGYIQSPAWRWIWRGLNTLELKLDRKPLTQFAMA